MPRFRPALALFSLLLTGAVLLPASAPAGSFAQLWALPGWDYVKEVGETDTDGQRELLFANKADRHLAIVDGLTGAIEKEFPAFRDDNSALTTQDVDGDGRLELFFWRPASGPVTPLVTGYDWVSGSYATLFSHTDSCEYWALVSLRNASTFEAIESSASDIRVRDLAGTVLFRASTAIPGWSGTGAFVIPMDIDEDGTLELGAIERSHTPNVKVHFFNYATGFTPAWTVTGWQPQGAFHSDDDSQPEIIMANWTDGRYGLFDGISGALEQDFPGFSIFNSTNISGFDTDGNGSDELFFRRPEFFPVTRLFTAYKWNGASYATMFSHTEQVDDFSAGNFRTANGLELLEMNQFPNAPVGEVRIRDLNGTVLFRASTQIPGWSGSNMYASTIDTDHDGIYELAIQDNTTLRFVRYSGSFVQPWSSGAWSLLAELSNVDGDPQSELVVASTTDQHYALLDPPTGALEEEFPAFTSDNGYIYPLDSDNDGRLELFFNRFTFEPPLFTGYDWTPSGYVTLLSHTDANEGFGYGHFRTPSLTEFAEFAANDLRLRDLSGTVLFRASTDLPGWTGVNRDMQVVDMDGDGVMELLAIDASAVRMVHFTGTTSVAQPGEGGSFELLASYPNPFLSGTAFRFSTRAAGDVGIRVFDVNGRMIRKLDQRVTAGPHELQWDGRDDQGRPVPSGILFYEVTADGARRSGRMVRLGR